MAQYVYSGRMDEVGQLRLALKMLEAETAGLVGRLSDSTAELTAGVSGLSAVVEQSSQGVQGQFNETDQVAAAVNEVSASIQEVADNAHNSALAAKEALDGVVKGKAVVDASATAIRDLKAEVGRAAAVIRQLDETSNSITGILDVIHGISEQTNLLALNAAIEAARAGDAGRGFARGGGRSALPGEAHPGRHR